MSQTAPAKPGVYQFQLQNRTVALVHFSEGRWVASFEFFEVPVKGSGTLEVGFQHRIGYRETGIKQERFSFLYAFSVQVLDKRYTGEFFANKKRPK
jgi:hypothetical protein